MKAKGDLTQDQQGEPNEMAGEHMSLHLSETTLATASGVSLLLIEQITLTSLVLDVYMCLGLGITQEM